MTIGSAGDVSAEGVDVLGAWIAALERVLAAFAEVSDDLPDDARGYLLTGSPTSVLARVAGEDAATSALCVHPYTTSSERETMRAFFAESAHVPADVLVRWARLIEAAVGGSRWPLSLEPVAGGRWADALLSQMAVLWYVDTSRPKPSSVPVEVAFLERVLVAGGAQISDLLAAVFNETTSRQGLKLSYARAMVLSMPGYAAAVARSADVLRPVITSQGVQGRLIALDMVTRVDDATVQLFAAQIADLATSTSGAVRTAAAALVGRCRETLVEPLKELALTGKPGQRLLAFRLLWSRASDDATRAWARERAAADRAASIQALAQEWAQAPVQPAGSAVAPVEQPRPVVDWRVPVTPELVAVLRDLWAEINRETERQNAKSAAYAATRTSTSGEEPLRAAAYAPLSEQLLEGLGAALEAGCPPCLPSEHVRLSFAGSEAVVRCAGAGALDPVVLVILLNHLGELLCPDGRRLSTATRAINALHEETGRPTLLELSTMLDQMHLDGGWTVYQAFAAQTWCGEPLGWNWPNEDVAPFVVACFPLIRDSLSGGNDYFAFDSEAPFRACATLPTVPPHIVDALFPFALSGSKPHRRLIQDVLARVPGIEKRIATALSDGKADVRAEMASWLGRSARPAAIPALETAIAKETQDVAKGAMLDALDALGQPVEKYLDHAALDAQASGAVTKGLPKYLAWLSWEGLPQVCWSDTGEPVPTTTLRWLIVQAAKAKSPEPNALVRRYCAMVAPRDREELGRFLLESWMAEDTRFRTDLGEPVGSAIGSKGVLAVVAACAGDGAVAPVGRYLKDWCSTRTAQCKALISMLAWIDHPSATQLMLSVGSRFRTPGLRDEATRQAEALAERKGWTVDELADRTVPVAGLDETGTLELSFGERTFTAVLMPDLTVSLRSPEGATIGSLPSPRADDDADQAKAAKATLMAARKELKDVVRLQTERLYEALCTQRTWTYEEWDRYLARHPIVRHLIQRLVWTAVTGDGPPVVFRALDDGTVTDIDDAAVTLTPGATVRIAHDTNLEDTVVVQWHQHLRDYDVVPLFQQFGKGTYVLPSGGGTRKEITDFMGHLIEAFTLRRRATTLGYSRCAAEDGGCVDRYERRFPTLGLSAVIRSSGSWLSEENRTVALTRLEFARSGGGRGPAVAVRLADVPPVLLSEAYNDMRLIAADGPGYDPSWEKMTEL